MPGLALALWAVALIFAFGLRVAVQYRSTGKSGIVVHRERPLSTPWWAAILFQGSMLVMPLGAVLDLIGEPGAIGALDSPGIAIAGSVAAIAGIAAVAASQAAMGPQWRIGVEAGTDLVTDGPFRHVRNPIYTGMIVAFGGIVLTDPTPIVLAGFAMLNIGIQLQVRAVEEPHLMAAHGAEFRAYASRVGRFVPGVGRISA